MTTTDPIADMLARIKNAIGAGQNEISLPHSKIKQSVAELLKAANFIDDVAVTKEDIGQKLHITIYKAGTNARISDIERLSKPGKRLYSSAQEIPVVKGGRGIVILSTSKGLMTGSQAKTNRMGGELICKVY